MQFHINRINTHIESFNSYILYIFYEKNLTLFEGILYVLQEAKCGYCIIIMAVFWVTEALPIAVTSLLPVILFPMVGLMYAKDVSSTYINVCLYKIFKIVYPPPLKKKN